MADARYAARVEAMLLTTKEVAALLKVHPKHVYRLLKRGLPAHRVGDEWRFDEQEVRRYCRTRGQEATDERATEAPVAPPLLAANGDVLLDALLDEALKRAAPLVGHVQADHGTGIAMLGRGAVLLTGCHGVRVPGLGDAPVARVHLAEREVGLTFRRGLRVRRVSAIVGRRLASRPSTAGIRVHLDAALHADGIEAEPAYARAAAYASHRDVVMAVLRNDAEVGLASRGWAVRAGLGFFPLASEAYGLVLRARDLGDERVTSLCEIAMSAAYRRRLRADFGYDPRRSGDILIGRRRVPGAFPGLASIAFGDRSYLRTRFARSHKPRTRRRREPRASAPNSQTVRAMGPVLS
jgi:excisionase family DNA binding protein